MNFAMELGLFWGFLGFNPTADRRRGRGRWIFRWTLLGLVLVAALPRIALGQIESVTRLTACPSQYGRTDFVIMLTAEWSSSPYCSAEAQLDLDLTCPSGKQLVVPAFFEHGTSGHSSSWRARFTPVEAGAYAACFILANAGQTNVSAKSSFQVAPSNRRGFLHAGDGWVLRFDNGEAFRGLGENVAWEARNNDDSKYFRDLQENPRYHYEYMLGTLASDGGNFFRTWMCPWNLPLEWKTVANTNRYRNDDHYFNGSAIERLDEVVSLADELDVYMMLTLDNSGDLQGGNWRRNSYNIADGGSAATAQDFFTDPCARAQYRDRLRYLVARWGYSPHVAVWEFFNEIDNLMYGLPQRIPDEVITQWHTEMAGYLKSIDPYHHLVSTSISHRPVAGLDQIASLDFNQRHIYGHDGRSQVATFPSVLRQSLAAQAKPLVIGECGFEWDWNRNFDDYASGMDSDFKRALWLGLFSPTPILPMSWWWEYFDHRGMTPYLKHVRSVLDQMLSAGHGSFAETQARWNGPPAEVLAVRCGETVFTLIENEGTNAIAGGLTLPLERGHKYRISTYDPERDATNSLPALNSGAKPVPAITVPAENFVIVIAAPTGRRK
jgi:hypothetical protein